MDDKEAFVNYIGPLAAADMKATGVLASVTAAQAILESNYGTSELAAMTHNLFGMKAKLSGDTWPSSWGGPVYTKKTKEQRADGSEYEISADFRSYESDAASIRDHSNYLLWAMDSGRPRYAGLAGERDPKTVAQIIKKGGYATDVRYVDKLLALIERWGLQAYDMEGIMEIIKKTATTNTTAAPGRTITYIVEHYTAGTSSRAGSARNTAAWFSQARAKASADFIVDDGEIVQYNPDPKNRYCWAVGGASWGNKGGRLFGVAKNANCISIEICSTNDTGQITYPNDGHWHFTEAVLVRAAELTRYLMQEYGIDADHVIRHYDVNGKPCPGVIGWNEDSGNVDAWTSFRARLSSSAPQTEAPATSGGKRTIYRVRTSWWLPDSQIGAYSSLANAKKAADEHAGYKVYGPDGAPVYDPEAGNAAAFRWHVNVSDLSIREGPGVRYDRVGFTGIGTFTIVDVQGGWGKLKSGAGWISLSEKYGHKV